MFRKLFFGALAVLLLPLGMAQAGVEIGVGIGAPYRPYYHRPYYHHYRPGVRVFLGTPPVYVAPAPVYVRPVVPAPVYVQPAPIYVQPVPVQPVVPSLITPVP